MDERFLGRLLGAPALPPSLYPAAPMRGEGQAAPPPLPRGRARSEDVLETVKADVAGHRKRKRKRAPAVADAEAPIGVWVPSGLSEAEKTARMLRCDDPARVGAEIAGQVAREEELARDMVAPAPMRKSAAGCSVCGRRQQVGVQLARMATEISSGLLCKTTVTLGAVHELLRAAVDVLEFINTSEVP